MLYLFRRVRTASPRRSAPRTRLSAERLEDRAVPAVFTIADGAVEANVTTSHGGGIVIFGSQAKADLTDCVVNGNVSAGSGGGLLTGLGAQLTLTRCAVTNNQARLEGGGVSNLAGAVTLTGC